MDELPAVKKFTESDIHTYVTYIGRINFVFHTLLARSGRMEMYMLLFWTGDENYRQGINTYSDIHMFKPFTEPVSSGRTKEKGNNKMLQNRS